MSKPIQCDGWRRTGVFQMGGTGKWERCKNEAVSRITVKQDGETKTFPGCAVCCKEAAETNGITIIKSVLISRAISSGGRGRKQTKRK